MNHFRFLGACVVNLLTLAHCSRNYNSLKKLDFGTFRLDVPNSWRQFTRQGYDPQVGGLTNGKDSIEFDYGWYSYQFRNETSATQDFISTQIDDRPATHRTAEKVRSRSNGGSHPGRFTQPADTLRYKYYQ